MLHNKVVRADKLKNIIMTGKTGLRDNLTGGTRARARDFRKIETLTDRTDTQEIKFKADRITEVIGRTLTTDK